MGCSAKTIGGEMSEGNQTWPEQNAVDEWCEKHAAKAAIGSWCIYADFSILMELKEAVTAYRITVDKERDALKARVTELEAARTWQPIETFYGEGAVLLFFATSNYQAIGYFDGQTWQLESGPTDEKPTHWQPLPEAPK